ncbi:MAG TPA: RidA family protein [Asticcacaulis sp.]|nr:RidA family protein [Asticcacaulis sp.]
MQIEHVNPEAMHSNPAFSHGITVSGPSQTLFIGGQNGVNAAGEILDGLGAQAEQALANLLQVVQRAGGSQANVVKLAIYIVQGQPVGEAFAAAQKVWGPHPTTVTVLMVAGLANPKFLIEVEGVAALSA